MTPAALTIGVMPKSTGNPYFEDCRRGAEEAAREVRFKVIVGFCSPALPGAAEAVKESGRQDVRITGVSLPSLCRAYVEEGVVASVVFWRTRDLGYLAAATAHALATGTLQHGAVFLAAGRLGNVIVRGDEIRLGRCHIVTKGNLDSLD